MPSCTFGASLAAARLHDLVHFRATVGGLAQVMLLYAAKQHTYVIFLIFFLICRPKFWRFKTIGL